MMGWLSDWLKQVILIILLAAFVDLLLPSQAMQRYVRTVVSLFLLLTLMTPVFELFTRGWNADQMLAEAEQLQSGTEYGAAQRGKGALRSLEAVLADAEEMKATNAQEAKRLAESQLAEEMKAGLAKATKVEITELQVTIDMDQRGTPVIGSVRAILSHTAADPPSGTSTQNPSSGAVRVESVKPVVVAVAPYGNKTQAAATAPDSRDQEEQRSLAVRYFEQEWQVSREHLAIGFTSQPLNAAAQAAGR